MLYLWESAAAYTEHVEHGHHEHAHGGGGNASTAREDMNDSTAEFKEIMHLVRELVTLEQGIQD